MTIVKLSRKLKETIITEILTIRIHRAISWLKSAEKQEGNLDMKFVSLWVSFNACYVLYLFVYVLFMFVYVLYLFVYADLDNIS